MAVSLLSSLVRRVGVDLGTDRIRIWTDREGVVVDEPTCLAVEDETKKVVAVGSDAVAMRGRVGSNISLHYPIHKGAVWDPEVLTALLTIFLQRVVKISPLISPMIMASVPAHSTEAERQVVVEVISGLGAQEVFTIAQPLAASIGSGVPIADASGSFFLHLGAGVVEGAVISLGSMVEFESTSYGAGFLLERLKYTLKKEKNIVVSLETARKILIEVASVVEESGRKKLVAGQDAHKGSPTEVEISSADVFAECRRHAKKYEKVLRKLLSRVPPELTVDIIDKGLLLSGGLAQLDGLPAYLVQQLGTPVSVVERPETAAIEGIGTALEHIELFKQSLGYRR